MRMHRSFFALAALFLAARAQAYPISPVPLWPLTKAATHIVVAKVEKVERRDVDDEDKWLSCSHQARLRILQTLKGPELDAIEVPYPRTWTCPAPPVYREGSTVVAFLYQGEDSTFSTVALSYGTLYPTGAELVDMKAMIRLALFIQNAGFDDETLAEHKRAWLVRAAALPGTRWHGLYELEPASDQIRSFYDHSGREGRIAVDAAGQTLLAEAFLATKEAESTLSMLLAVLARFADERVDREAIAWVEGLLALEDPPWWTREMLQQTLRRLDERSASDRFARIEGRNWPGEVKDWRQIWRQAQKDLGIPKVEARTIQFESHLPVGGQTPP